MIPLAEKLTIEDQISRRMRPNQRKYFNRFLLSVCPAFSPIDLSGWMIRIKLGCIRHVKITTAEETNKMINLAVDITAYLLVATVFVTANTQFTLKPVTVIQSLRSVRSQFYRR